MFKIFVAITFWMISGFAYSGDTITPLAPDFKLEGHSAAELSAAWWMWAMSSPAQINPVRDKTGAHCDIGQRGNVWFLAGGFGSNLIRRSCTIPAGKYIFFPIVNMSYWPREEHNGYTCEQAIKSAAVNNETAIDLFVEVDGAVVANPKKYRASTKKCFDIYEWIPKEYKPYNAYPSASDGYWILLKPLEMGSHTIIFGGQYNHTTAADGHMVQDIVYKITVK